MDNRGKEHVLEMGFNYLLELRKSWTLSAFGYKTLCEKSPMGLNLVKQGVKLSSSKSTGSKILAWYQDCMLSPPKVIKF